MPPSKSVHLPSRYGPASPPSAAEHGAVVRRENEQCVLSDALFVKSFHEFTDLPVDFANHIAVSPRREVPLKRSLGIHGVCGNGDA